MEREQSRAEEDGLEQERPVAVEKDFREREKIVEQMKPYAPLKAHHWNESAKNVG